GHDLEQFPFRPDVAVRGVCRVGTKDQEHLGKRERKDHQKEVPAGEEERSREDGEDKVTEHVEALRLVHHGILFLEELAHVVERLENRGADPALHMGGDLAVDTGDKAADDRRKQDEHDGPGKGDHRIPPPTSAAANMITIKTEQRQTPALASLTSPNHGLT